MIRNLLAAISILAVFYLSPAYAQNTTCSTRPVGDNSNACATTKFVNDEISTLGAGTVANMAALRAIVAPTTAISVYMLGYFAPGDGGEGRFTYNTSSATADNAGTIIQPNSLPATGRWLREYISENGNNINVRWFGAKGDGITDDTSTIAAAQAVAVAAWSGLYLPSTPTSGCYLATITVLESTQGLKIYGDGKGFGGAGPGTCITSNSSTATIIVSSPTGAIDNIIIDNLKIYSSGSGDGIQMVNVGWPTISNLVIYAVGAGCGINLQNVASYVLINNQSYGIAGHALCIGDNGLSNSGPGVVSSGIYAIQGGTGTSAIQINGSPLGAVFDGIFCETNGPNAQACVTLDGDAGGGPTAQVGHVTFIDYHGESNFNTGANTMSEILVGATNKFGSLTMIGGNAWGHGDGTHYERDFLRVVAARNVTLKDFIASKLGATNGFSRAMVRLEATFPAAGDSYDFSGLKADISGALYSDANGRCTGSSACIGGGVIVDSLALGTALPATSGGTGKASYAIGDILYANTTTTLASLADIATTNALISGGVGVAPSWGKIGNSTLTNSSTTVNGQTCILGSTCTVTASATAITVGTTTVGGGTTTRILYDNVGVLGEYTISGSGTVVAMNTGPAISSPTFTSTVTATGLIKNSDLATMVTNTVKGNATSGTASPTDLAMTSCSTAASALIWTTNTGFGCNTSITANTATTATSATNTAITDDVATNTSMFPTWVTANTGNLPQKTSSTKLIFNPSMGNLSSTIFTSNSNSGTPAAATISGSGLQVIGANAAFARILIDSYGTSVGATFNGRHARGTAASPTATQNGDVLLILVGQGYGTTGFDALSAYAGLNIYASENHSDTAQGSEVAFVSTPNTTVTTVEGFRLLNTGQHKFTAASNFSANGAVATVLGVIGPTGSHTTVQEWLTFQNASGVTRYVPAF